MDLNFIPILSNNPRKALSYARNIDEVNQAKTAIAELEKVSFKIIKLTQQLNYTKMKYDIPTHPIREAESSPTLKTNHQIKLSSNTPTFTSPKAKAEAAKATAANKWIDLVNSAEDDELPDIDAAPVVRIPAPEKPKASSFAPSSAKRGRGSRGGRGSTTRGRGSATRGTRGGNTKKRGTTRKSRTSYVFDTDKNPEASEVVEDMSEIDRSLPRYEQLRQIVAHKQAGGVPEGNVEQLNQNIKDNEVRVPEPQVVADIPLAAMMPFGEKATRKRNMPANLPTDKKIIEFVLMQDNYAPDENRSAKGVGLPSSEIFEDLIAEALSKTVDMKMDWCNEVSKRYVTKYGICVIAINYGYPDGAELFKSNITDLSNKSYLYNTYLAADLLRKYAVTVFFHSGFKRPGQPARTWP